jgi:biotin carboxyl carrier protein
MKYTTTVGDETFTVEINREDEIIVNGKAYAIDFVHIGEKSNLYSLLIDNQSFEALVEEREGQWQVLLHGHLYTAGVADDRAQLMAARASSLMPETGEVAIKAPMPGLVVAIPVEKGQGVEAGDTVVILESMKMENELKAPRAGRVERIAVKAGDSVEQHQALVVIT